MLRIFYQRLCTYANTGQDRSYFGGLLVGEDLRVDPVELQNDFVHQLSVQSAVSFEEGAVLQQLLMKTVCPYHQSKRNEVTIKTLGLAFTLQHELTVSMIWSQPTETSH